MKTLKYKVVEISSSGEIISFDRSVFDTKEEAIDFIQDFDEEFMYLTILEVWD